MSVSTFGGLNHSYDQRSVLCTTIVWPKDAIKEGYRLGIWYRSSFIGRTAVAHSIVWRFWFRAVALCSSFISISERSWCWWWVVVVVGGGGLWAWRVGFDQRHTVMPFGAADRSCSML